MTAPTLVATGLSGVTDLDQYAATPFPTDWPADRRVFFSPVDNVHGALLHLISSATESLTVAMYGLDDPELVSVIHSKLADPTVSVQLTLDSSQAAGATERGILAANNFPASVIAIGRSERGAIMHLKAGVIDGRYVFDGSTNWSGGGEAKQDNQLTISDSRVMAARYRARIDAIHAHMLAAAAARSQSGAAA